MDLLKEQEERELHARLAKRSKIITLLLRAVPPKHTELTATTMHRTTRAWPAVPDPQDTTKKQEQAMKENVFGSAFDSIFEAYPNEDAVSKALKEAKDKVARYADERRAISLGAANRDQIVNRIKTELIRLEESVEERAKVRVSKFDSLFRSVDEPRLDSEFVRETMAVVASFIEKAQGAAQVAERERRLIAEEEKAEKLVGMLEAAKLVLNFRGTKRRSDDTLHNEVEVVEVRPKRHRLLRERK